MTRLFVLALTGVSALGIQVASAADIFVPPPPIEYIEEVKPDFSGWYIRGDVGYAFESKTDGEWAFYNIFEGVQGIDDYYRYDELRLEGAATFGAGAGYRFNDILRADATVDFFRADVSGNTKCPLLILADPAHNLGPFDECYYEDNSKADVWTIMANAYVDLPSFGRITPYLGAGIGTAYIKYDDVASQEICPPCDPSYTPYSGNHDGTDDWRFASALMAGASVDLTDRLALDIGYRFTKIWEGDAWEFDDADKEFGNASGVQTVDNGFDIHTVRAGLRYSFF